MIKRCVFYAIFSLALFSSFSPGMASVRKLPLFHLYTLRGEEVVFCPEGLSLLFFFTPECSSCFAGLLDLLENLESLERRIPLYTVCLRCDFRSARNIEESFGGRLTVYLAHPELPALLGVWETPAVFLVNGERRVLYQEKGTISWEALRSALPSEKRDALEERQPVCVLGLCS